MTRRVTAIGVIAVSMWFIDAPALAGPPVLDPASFVRVRADNHFGVVRNHEIFLVFTAGSFGDSVVDEEIGTAARAENTATYEVSLTGTTAVFDIRSTQQYSVGSSGNLTEGFIHFTLDEPYVYELSGNWSGTSTDAGDAYQQRTFLRQFQSPFATVFLEDETTIGAARWLYVNHSNDTAGGTFNQSGPRVGVLPPGTYEFMYELEGRDNDVDQAGQATATGRVRLVLRKPLPPTSLQAVTSGGAVSIGWTASPDATSYVVEAGRGPGGSDIFVGDIGNSTSLQSPAPPGLYYVRVRTRRGTLLGDPSEEIVFTLGSPACTGPPAAPAAHSVLSIGLSARLRWGSVPGATAYTVEAGSGSGGSNLFNASVGGRMELTAAAPAGGYFTRVRATNSCGTSPPSNEVSFAVSCSAPAAPADLAFTKINGVLTITWTASYGAGSYVLQAGTASGASNAFNQNIGTATQFSAPTAGVPAGTYFVRVVPVGTCGTGTPSPEVAITIP